MTVIFINDETGEELNRYHNASHVPADGEWVELSWKTNGEKKEFAGIVTSRQWKYMTHALNTVKVKVYGR